MGFDSTGVWSTFFATPLGETERLSIVNLAIGDKNAGSAEVVLCFPADVATSLATIDFPEVFDLLTALSRPFSEPTIPARGGLGQPGSGANAGSTVDEANRRIMPDNSVTIHRAGPLPMRPSGFDPIEGDDKLCFYGVELDYRKLGFKDRHFDKPGRSIYLAFTYQHESIVHPGLRVIPTASGNPNYYTAVSDDFDGEPSDGSPHGFGMPDFSQSSSLQSSLPLGTLQAAPGVKTLHRVRATKPSAVPLFCRRK